MAAVIQALIPAIYHERQESGMMLCAQHALNSLLQDHIFTAPVLSEIARNLDEDENRELDDAERAATSMNMDDTGFFSVQVLQKALQAFALDLVPWEAESLRPYHKHPETQMAFVLNRAEHWYTLRRFGNVSRDPALDADPGGGYWFDLNSQNPAPSYIGNIHLGMILHEAMENGYSIFAVIQKDPGAELALPRTHADTDFSYLAGNEGLEDVDMDLQAALQASLGGGDFGDYIPQRLEPPSLPQQQRPAQPPAVLERRYEHEVIDVDDGVDDASEGRADRAPEDPVAASTARQRAVMEQMRRTQEVALQEQYEDEITRINTAAHLRHARGSASAEDEDEDEMLRRAIAESEAMAQTQGSGETSRDEVAPSVPRTAPTWQQHRVYDDEDEELQAALRASLEGVSEDFPVASPPPVIPPPSVQPARQPTISSPAAPPIQQQSSIDFETESESEAPEPEQLSLEEIRRRRLARFGG